MKVLAIHGSPRTVRSMTRRLAGFVLEGAAETGAEVDMIDLADLRILPCTACEACMLNGVCVNDDDVPSLLNRMKEADALVFGSPVYIDNVSGQMKIFFDRLADAIHYQVFSGKYGCSVATTAESGGKEVVAYLDHVLNYLGIISVGSTSVATGGGSDVVETDRLSARDLGKKLVQAVRNGYHDSVQEEIISGNREYFQTIVEEYRDFRPDEFDRWVTMGWIKEKESP